MDFQPKDYYEAASDRMDQADLLYSLAAEYCQGLEDRRYAWVVYSAGLAVECMLRAYIRRVTNKFSSRHDLSRLFVESRLDTRVVEHLGKQGYDAGSPVVVERLTRLYAAAGVVARIWRNNYRFASDGVLIRDFLDRKVVRARDNKGAKAQVLRKQAHLLLLGAGTIIKAGKEAWT
ncbi:MAG TPA: hypothetical protein DDY78_01570 [Planctomycetales bacterium]|jgi:hypothetical protein|nr:hypothetical protein [Planctomycetales bacterium]